MGIRRLTLNYRLQWICVVFYAHVSHAMETHTQFTYEKLLSKMNTEQPSRRPAMSQLGLSKTPILLVQIREKARKRFSGRIRLRVSFDIENYHDWCRRYPFACRHPRYLLALTDYTHPRCPYSEGEQKTIPDDEKLAMNEWNSLFSPRPCDQLNADIYELLPSSHHLTSRRTANNKNQKPLDKGGQNTGNLNTPTIQQQHIGWNPSNSFTHHVQASEPFQTIPLRFGGGSPTVSFRWPPNSRQQIRRPNFVSTDTEYFGYLRRMGFLNYYYTGEDSRRIQSRQSFHPNPEINRFGRGFPRRHRNSNFRIWKQKKRK